MLFSSVYFLLVVVMIPWTPGDAKSCVDRGAWSLLLQFFLADGVGL